MLKQYISHHDTWLYSFTSHWTKYWINEYLLRRWSRALGPKICLFIFPIQSTNWSKGLWSSSAVKSSLIAFINLPLWRISVKGVIIKVTITVLTQRIRVTLTYEDEAKVVSFSWDSSFVKLRTINGVMLLHKMIVTVDSSKLWVRAKVIKNPVPTINAHEIVKVKSLCLNCVYDIDEKRWYNNQSLA